MLNSVETKKVTELKRKRELNREEKTSLLSVYLNPSKNFGLEIGPDIRPVFSKMDGLNVEYMEVCDTEELKEKCKKAGKDLNKVQKIDHVFSSEKTLTEIIGKSNCYDYVVSSHVLEHIPDIITHFKEVSKLLTDEGLYGLIIPDKKLSFDALKPSSTLGQILQAYLEKRKEPPLSSFFDNIRYTVASKETGKGWRHIDNLDKRSLLSENYIEKLKNILDDEENNQYKNWFGHVWHFTLDSFLSIFSDLKSLGLIDFKLIDFHPTGNMDFIVIIAKNKSDFPELSYEQGLKNIQRLGYLESCPISFFGLP